MFIFTSFKVLQKDNIVRFRFFIKSLKIVIFYIVVYLTERKSFGKANVINYIFK